MRRQGSKGSGMRVLYAATLVAALGVGEALAEDNGTELFQRFAKTCAMKPISGEALDARARSIGYVPQNGPIAPDDPKRDPDDVFFWRLPDQGVSFALDAYFTGRRAHYQVVCSIRGENVDFAAFVEGLKRETTLPDPKGGTNPNTGAPIYTWTVDADGGKDKLEVAAYGEARRRVLVTLTYDVIAR
jgi:hypothetical protein